MLKIDLGGGPRPKEGFINVDRHAKPPEARCDFDAEPLPFADDVVIEAYSSHMLEHLVNPVKLLREICRVCRLRATVEIRTPHWNSSMAMCDGHINTISDRQMRYWTKDFLKETWGDDIKRLALTRTQMIPSEVFPAAKAAFPHLSDQQVMQFVPDTVHEVRWFLIVVENK